MQLLQAGLLTAEMLGRAAVFLLLWSLASTLLVVGLGTWIALRRALRGPLRG